MLNKISKTLWLSLGLVVVLSQVALIAAENSGSRWAKAWDKTGTVEKITLKIVNNTDYHLN